MAQDYVNWGFMTDVFNGDQGLAYYWNQSQRPEYWTLFSPGIDLCLVNISLISYEYNPSRVNLRINLTFFVKDYLLFSFGGSILLTGPFNGANGIIFLDTMADFTVYYQAIWSCWYYNQTKAFVLFKGNSLTNTVEWNMTISTKYPVWDSSIQGVGKYSLRLMNFSLPTDYSVSQVYFNYISYSSWGTIKLKDKQILIILGNTGNWLIRMYSPNYVEEVHAFNGPKELNQFYVGNLLNVTAKLKALTNVAANLTIYNISNKILRNETQIPIAYWAKFNLWPIPQNDSLYLVVFWANGTEVGIRSLEIMCVYHTRLTKNSPDANTDLGLITGTSPIKIGVFYSDTDNKVGIPSATITVNITPYGVVEYDSLSHPGYYNLTISTSLLINGNWTAKIQANRRGYNISDLFIQFQLRIGKNATLSVVGGCRWQAGRWWLNPNPYFDDTSHKVTVFYANGTSPYEGIQYAQVVGKPNWTSTFWYGIPTNISPGFYDISINTAGLHEADIGRVDFTAYSPYFETKLVNISLIIVEIPAILLSMDAGVYQNITCYEGESFGIAVGYWDEFHSKPILFENPTQGNLTWQIIGTAAYGTLQKSVWQYEGTISLPAWGILGTKTYNLEITATALRDYAIYEKNLTLNVKSKENTTLLLTISTSGEYRVGNSFYIFANLTFENKTPLINTKVDFNITLWHQGLWNGSLFDSRVTNTMGIATYYYSEIPNGIDQIRINVTYEGTPQIDPVTSWLYISVLPKYNVSLLLSNFTLHKYRVGQDLYLLATLRLEDGSYLSNQPIIFNISFYNGINLIQRIIETRFTDLLGNISYYIGSIPDLTNILIYSASFTETKTILGCINRTIIPIGPKYNISLTIISQIPQEIMVGNTLELEALLLNEETKIGLANETIEFILIFDKNNTITRFATTDAQGHAIIELLIPNDKSNYDSFKIEVRYAGSAIFKNATYTAANSVTIMTWTKIIINLLPYIGIAIAIIIGSYLSYRQFVAVPRRRRRQAHIEKIASKYSDLINLQHILVIHSTTGSCIYQHSFGEVTFDPDLLSGFLTAISAFESELKIPTPSKPLLSEKLPHKEEASRGFELNYANFKVLLNVGHLTRTALILTTSASENLRKSLGEFVDKFEERYKGDLIDWKGAMAPFRSADQLVETTFETNLLWPHIIESISEDRMKALNSLESSLVTLALTMQREKQYFFLPALVPMVEKVRHTPMVEILGSIDDLRHKGIFKAISIEELERRLQQGATNSNTKT